MPNHVQNRLKIVGKKEDIENVINSVKGDREVIDFNKIVPMPKELDIESGSSGEMGLAFIKQKVGAQLSVLEKVYVDRWDELTDENKNKYLQLGFCYLKNIVNYGHSTWYDWCRYNWGTKWNAYDTELKNDNEIWFNTAWNDVAEKIIRKLSIMFPNVTFKYSFSDEGTAYNCGNATFKDGFGTLSLLDNLSKEAFDLYKELHPQYADDYEWVNGEIKYKNE